MLTKGAGGTHIMLLSVPAESWQCSFEHVCRSTNGYCYLPAGYNGSDSHDNGSSSYSGYGSHGGFSTCMDYSYASDRLGSLRNSGFCWYTTGRVSCHAGPGRRLAWPLYLDWGASYELWLTDDSCPSHTGQLCGLPQ